MTLAVERKIKKVVIIRLTTTGINKNDRYKQLYNFIYTFLILTFHTSVCIPSTNLKVTVKDAKVNLNRN